MATDNDYFRLPSFISMILVPVGMALVSVAHLSPDVLPWDYLIGPVGSLTKFLVEKHPSVLAGIFYCAWILHFGESAYAYHLCQRKNLTTGVKWAAVTFIYGVFSLKHLLLYHPKNQ